MGNISAFEFVPSDYKIRYVDSMNPSNITSLNQKDMDTTGKKITVVIPKHLADYDSSQGLKTDGIELKFE